MSTARGTAVATADDWLCGYTFSFETGPVEHYWVWRGDQATCERLASKLPDPAYVGGREDCVGAVAFCCPTDEAEAEGCERYPLTPQEAV